jgi:hypothetical protein
MWLPVCSSTFRQPPGFGFCSIRRGGWRCGLAGVVFFGFGFLLCLLNKQTGYVINCHAIDEWLNQIGARAKYGQ